MTMTMILLPIMISVGELEEAVEILTGAKGSHTSYYHKTRLAGSPPTTTHGLIIVTIVIITL